MTKQFDAFSMSGDVIAQVEAEEATRVREILQQISDITGTPKDNMSLVRSGDVEAVGAMYLEDDCLGQECFVEGAQTILTVVVFDVGKHKPAEEATQEEFGIRHVVKKLTPCMINWVSVAFTIVAFLSVFGVAMGVFLGFIFCCVAIDTDEGPNLLEKICFVLFISGASISIICTVARSTYKAIIQGKLRESLHSCACNAIGAAISLITFGGAVAVFLGFIFCCIAMDTDEGPNLLEEICFGLFISGACISIICIVACATYKAIIQGKLRETLQNWVFTAVGGAIALMALGGAMGVFLGFIFCSVAMDTDEGPNLLEKICFALFISGASISIICVVARAAYKAIIQGKLCESLHSCAYNAIAGAFGLIVFGVALTVFLGFIFCCIAMDTDEGPDVFELICFVAFISGVAFAFCFFVYTQIRDALQS